MLKGKQASAILVLLCISASLQFVSGEESSNTDVCINEVLPWPTSGEKYIEIYNPTNAAIDLAGYLLVLGENRSVFTLAETLEPLGYLVFWESGTGLNPWARGDTISLYNALDEMVDRFEYSYSDQQTPFARLPDGGEWHSPTEMTPGFSNGGSPPVVSQLYITSFLPRISSRWEYVTLSNPTSHDIYLEGWRFSNTRGTWILPRYDMGPGETATAARESESFEAMMGIPPDMEPRTGTMILGDNGDALLLKDPWGRVVDMVWYGDVEPCTSWGGPSAHLPRVGEAMNRASYSMTYEDWPQRLYAKAGATTFTGGMHSIHGATIFVSPDAGFEPLVSFIENSTYSLSVNVYQLTHPVLTEALVEASHRGVDVRILLDGNSVGWRWPGGDGEPTEEALQELSMLTRIHESGGRVRFVTDDGSTARGKRYRFNHAKYALADGGIVFISTENWKTTGFPSAGQEGNRGWSVILDSSAMAEQLMDVFESDWRGLGDVVNMGVGRYEFVWEHPESDYPTVDRIPQHAPLVLENGFEARLIVGPEENMVYGSEHGVLGIIDNASTSIYVQLLSLSTEWNIEGGINNPYVDALLEAATRGVEVKILLDQTYVNMSSGGNDNYQAMLWLVERAQGLPLEVRLGDSEGMGVSKIHTKSMVVDESIVLLSSVNWNVNSILRNREIGIIMWSEEAAVYYQEVFLWDWLGGGEVSLLQEETTTHRNTILFSIAVLFIASTAAFSAKKLKARGGRGRQW